MKISIVIVIFFVVSQAFPFFDLGTEEWKAYKSTYKKKYESDTEEKFRMKIFMENLNKIAKHNQRFEMGLVSYKLAINKYTDMLNNELLQIFYSFNRTNTLYADTRRKEGSNASIAIPMVTATNPYHKINNLENVKRSKRFIPILFAYVLTTVIISEQEKELIRSQIAMNREKIEVEKQILKSLEIENMYKEAREKMKIEIENIMLSKEKERLQYLETENKYKQKLLAIRLQIERTKLVQIEEARRSIILQKGRLEFRINRLQNELNTLENELNTLKTENSKENVMKIKEIEEKMKNIEENIEKIGHDIINYTRLSFSKE